VFERILGLIVVVRIALSFAIDIEVDGVAPWRKAATAASSDPKTRIEHGSPPDTIRA